MSNIFVMDYKTYCDVDFDSFPTNDDILLIKGIKEKTNIECRVYDKDINDFECFIFSTLANVIPVTEWELNGGSISSIDDLFNHIGYRNA